MIKSLLHFFIFSLICNSALAGMYVSPIAGEDFSGSAEMIETNDGYILNLSGVAAKRLILESLKTGTKMYCRDNSNLFSSSTLCTVGLDKNFNITTHKSIYKLIEKYNASVRVSIRSPELELWRGQSQISLSGHLITNKIINSSKEKKIIRNTSPDFISEITQTGSFTCVKETRMGTSNLTECFLNLHEILGNK